MDNFIMLMQTGFFSSDVSAVSSSEALPGLLDMLFRFGLNFLVVWFIIRFFYYRKSKRMDYLFTFILISISIFFLIYLLDNVQIQIGMALGIFAIFGIIRYRTETVPIREMTYLFSITALSVIGGLSLHISNSQLIITYLVFIFVIWILETVRWKNHTNIKMIIYDKIQLITPDREEELVTDIEERTGLKIDKLEIGQIDFMRDIAYIKIFYESKGANLTNSVTHFPKWNEVEE